MNTFVSENKKQPTIITQSGKRIRAIAFYLPQFYPTPENDAWWGKGFTEWVGVAKAKPLFPGHYQPHIPADLGFYDLRLPETRAAQAEMAQLHGIEGFCYWHYWFEGRRMLERPFNEVLRSGEPDFPFCLAWANHTWSRSWLGDNTQILLKQGYSLEDDVNHVRWLLDAFADPRYIRVKNRPLFLVYNPRDLPDANQTTDIFRAECVRYGLPEPFLLGINTRCVDLDARSVGFDGTLDHQPQFGRVRGSFYDGFSKWRLLHNIKYRRLDGKSKIYDYEEVAGLDRDTLPYPAFPSVLVGWDNTPRRGEKATIVMGGTPEKFADQLSLAIRQVSDAHLDERLIFINAWNEWGEGMHLEPDLRFGTQYVEVVKQVVHSVKGLS